PQHVRGRADDPRRRCIVARRHPVVPDEAVTVAVRRRAGTGPTRNHPLAGGVRWWARRDDASARCDGTTTPPRGGAMATSAMDAGPDADAGFGWLVFAGTILGLAGIMRIVDAIWAFRYNGALPENLQDGVLGSDLKNYGWTWLIVGIILIVASGLLLVRSQVARWVGYIAAAIAGITAVTWMPYYPIWSLMYIGLAVLV